MHVNTLKAISILIGIILVTGILSNVFCSSTQFQPWKKNLLRSTRGQCVTRREGKTGNPKVSPSADLDPGRVAAHSWHQFYSPALVLPVRGGETRQRHRSAGHVYSAGDVGYRLTHGLTLRGKNQEPGASGRKFFTDTRLVESHKEVKVLIQVSIILVVVLHQLILIKHVYIQIPKSFTST